MGEKGNAASGPIGGELVAQAGAKDVSPLAGAKDVPVQAGAKALGSPVAAKGLDAGYGKDLLPPPGVPGNPAPSLPGDDGRSASGLAALGGVFRRRADEGGSRSAGPRT